MPVRACGLDVQHHHHVGALARRVWSGDPNSRVGALHACRSRSAGSSRAGRDTRARGSGRGSGGCAANSSRANRSPKTSAGRRSARRRRGRDRETAKKRKHGWGRHRRRSVPARLRVLGRPRPSRHLHDIGCAPASRPRQSQAKPPRTSVGAWSDRASCATDSAGSPATIRSTPSSRTATAAFDALDRIARGGFWVGLLRVRPGPRDRTDRAARARRPRRSPTSRSSASTACARSRRRRRAADRRCSAPGSSSLTARRSTRRASTRCTSCCAPASAIR